MVIVSRVLGLDSEPGVSGGAGRLVSVTAGVPELGIKHGANDDLFAGRVVVRG